MKLIACVVAVRINWKMKSERGKKKMKKIMLLLSLCVVAAFMVACSSESAEEVIARAIYELDRVVIDESIEIHHGHDTVFEHAVLTFVGEEAGGNVLITIGDTTIQASINPSREHPSFESGYWHHHLYRTSTAAGSERINFLELLPDVSIDDNPDATDNTQSSYQRGNLHYIVATGEYRLRFMIEGTTTDLIFTLK